MSTLECRGVPAAPAPQGVPAHLQCLGSAKIRADHLARKAIVYVRQSSLQQVADHKESAARQYALADVAIALGWPRDRVVVIDEDQGRSGQSAVARSGFQHMLAELALDQVGIILGQDASRLARSDPDWAPLVRLCGVFHTLLCDYDGLYDPGDFNDRLLLGLKGIMSEAELHFLRGRMHEGRLNKARRGELYSHAPIGYVRVAGGGLALDPDQQAQDVVRLLFDQFDRQGSVYGLLRYLVRHGIRLPVRPHAGPQRGQLEWHRPRRGTLQNLLKHPVYAGYYRHGNRSTDARRQVAGRPGTGRTSQRPEDCVLLEGRCPAYITPERFWANQKRLADNRARKDARGVVRHGPALLGGLLRCGRCGQRLRVSYNGGGRQLRYNCVQGRGAPGQPLCPGLAGRGLDELVAAQVLMALAPARLELSLAAADDLERARAALHRNWQQQRERAGYEAGRARRQYDAAEPENRLVARELERRWEEALQQQRRIEEDYARFCQQEAVGLSAEERAHIRSLAQDLPALWQAASTTAADRQRVVRLLIEEVVIAVRGDTEWVDVTIRWAGGQTSSHPLLRPVRRYQQLADYERLTKRIAELRKAGRTLPEVAEQLNGAGFRPAKHSSRFTAGIVAALHQRRRRVPQAGAVTKAASLLRQHEWLLADLTGKLAMPSATLHRWIRAGWVHARKLSTPGGHWAIWADADELERMARLRTCPRAWSDEARRAELTQPKAK